MFSSGTPLAPRSVFVGRLLRSTGLALALIAVGLAAGMAGYHWIAGLGWVDAFLNASMILGGMGPVNPLEGTPSKLFAGVYALVLVGATGLMLGPILHRMLHKFHLDDSDLADDQR